MVSVGKRIIYFSVSLADGFVIEQNVWLHTDYTDIKFTNSALKCRLRIFSKHAPVPQTHADSNTPRLYSVCYFWGSINKD